MTRADVLPSRGVVAALAIGASLAAGCALVPARPPRDVSAEVGRLEAEVAAVGGAPARRPELHLALARLYLDPENPSRNYRAAQAELRFFAALDPRGASEPEVQRWLRALEVLNGEAAERDRLAARVEELANQHAQARRSIEALGRENQDLRRAAEGQSKDVAGLREAVKALTRENQDLKDQIEKLKELDRQLELLRRNVR